MLEILTSPYAVVAIVFSAVIVTGGVIVIAKMVSWALPKHKED